MTSTSLLGTQASSFASSALLPKRVRSAAKEIASRGRTGYRSVRCRIVRLLAWLAGVSPVSVRNLLRKLLAWRTRDMATQDNANTVGFHDISDHQLIRRIGEGAFGEVWLARNVLGAYRAVKIVRRSKFDSDRPFQRELDGIKHFDRVSRSHPGFVNILHVACNQPPTCFHYIMEAADDLV